MALHPAIYTRTAAGSADVCARQEEVCRDLIRQLGWPSPAVYTDTGHPGGSSYQRLIADITAGHIDAVVTFDLARFHRDHAALEAFLSTARAHEVTVHTVTGDIESNVSPQPLASIRQVSGSVTKRRQVKAARRRALRGQPE
ncbi:recombinase family protein [Nonomuraea sediminis]|uniref:recombinase family protein n=1 Tax=Nonomuraea sediminis TaxID=2835864 RepID=UPI001BDD08FA|nr:recombinase family protein [Nonomuraea sediminis]